MSSKYAIILFNSKNIINRIILVHSASNLTDRSPSKNVILQIPVSLLGQAVLTTVLAWLFTNEDVRLQMIVGGLILLFGIGVTFYPKQIALLPMFKNSPKTT